MGKRIKINKVPDGFVIKNGKILKKANYGGGFVTGDQMNYGLVTTYGADNGNNTQGQDVRFSLSAVPRDVANIEAEGGETVLTDLNNNGTFGLYNINGPRHNQGGVPMFLPDQSFIYSDTSKMKMTSPELAEFGIESKKRMTPAKVSKKFSLNEYIAAAGNPNSDHITENSAELMLNKNMMSLSQLAFGQEMKKDFQDGVPTAAFPFIQSQGQDPLSFAAMVDSQIAQRNNIAMMQKGGEFKPHMMYDPKTGKGYMANKLEDHLKMKEMGYLHKGEMKKAGKLPKAQRGKGERSETTKFSDLPPVLEKAIEQILEAASDPSSPEVQQQIKLIIDAAKGIGNAAGIDADQAENALNNIVKIVADNVEELAKTGRIPLITESMAKIDNMLQSQGIDIQDVMDVGDVGIEDTQGKQDSGLYGDVTMDNLPQFYENNKLLLQSLDYPNYESLEKKHGKEWYKDPAFVKDFQTKKNESLLARYDNDAELRASLDKQGITKDEFINAYGFRTDGVDGETDSIDGKFGEYTLNRRDFIELPGMEEEEEEEVPEDPADPEYEVPQPDFYQQDKIIMDALSKRDRDLFLPDRQAVDQIELNPALLDPTRAIASVNEQAAIAGDAAGMFGPETLSANLAKSTGTAYKNIADTLGKYDAANVGIINKADALQARFDQLTDAAERKNYADIVDGTNLAKQNYLDERNLDRETFADVYANAVTNRANTYNLNTLTPYYDIDPTTGGMVMNVDGKLFDPVQPSDPYAQIQKLSNYAKLAKASGLSDDVINNIFLGSGVYTGTNESTRADIIRNAGGINLPYSNTTIESGSRGKQIKAPAVPFYIGVTDGRRK